MSIFFSPEVKPAETVFSRMNLFGVDLPTFSSLKGSTVHCVGNCYARSWSDTLTISLLICL